MAKALQLEFELIPSVPILRGYLREPEGPIRKIIEVSPVGEDNYAPFLGAVLAETGRPMLNVAANFTIDFGRTTAPKAQIKRACQAAFEALQSTS